MTCTQRELEYARRHRQLYPERVKAATKKWRDSHREEFKEARRRCRNKNWLRSLYREARNRAVQRNIEFSIAFEDIPPIGMFCPLLGTLFTPSGSGDKRYAPSLDRIDPRKGYIKGNVWIVGYRANLVKNDGTAEEHESIAKAMRKALGEP